MDPFSYGYNRATPASAYMTAVEIVTSLIDIVSKNGNFLLDVGPQANGTIIDVEQTNLRQAGVWIKDHGEAIYNTTYWFVTPQEGDEIRFTQTLDAFYILTLSKPNDTLVLNSPIPWIEGDQVTVVGGNQSGTVVPSSKLANGSVSLNISDEVKNADQYAWVFKISFGGLVSGSGSGNSTGNGTGAGTGSGSTGTGSGTGGAGNGTSTSTSTGGVATQPVSAASVVQYSGAIWLVFGVACMLLL